MAYSVRTVRLAMVIREPVPQVKLDMAAQETVEG